jgi:hypothetical protein
MTIKLLFTAVLLTLGMGYLFAVTNIALSVGVSQLEIVDHYWGDPVVREALDAQKDDSAEAASGDMEMSFDDLDADVLASAPTLAIPTFDSLVAEGHFHMFGFTMIFFMCGLIISFADMAVGLKRTLILAPFIGSVFDIWSTLLTRFVGPGFSWMMMISGSLMAISFLTIFIVAMWQMWFMKGTRKEAIS